MIRLSIFFLVLSFLAVSGWLIDSTPFSNLVRLAVVAADGIMVLLAVTSLGRTIRFYGVWALGVFLAGAGVTIVYNIDRVDPLNQLAGLRLPLFFFCILIVTWDFLHSSIRQRFDRLAVRFLVVYALLQIPSSFYQFMKYGPSDEVGGTLGWGGTNAVTLSLFMIVFYLIVRYASDGEGGTFRLRSAALISLLLIPCALNETKISFLLLGLLVVSLVPFHRLRIAVPFMLFGVVLFAALNALYSSFERDTEFLLDPRFLERYLLYDATARGDLPRGQKLLYTFDLMAHDPPTYLIGLGYGMFSGGNVLGGTSFGVAVSYLTGARMFLNTVWLQGGILAVLCIGAALFHFVRSPHTVSPAMRRYKVFLMAVLGAMWVYHDSLYTRAFAGVAAYLVLWTESGGRDRADEDPHEEAFGAADAHAIETRKP